MPITQARMQAILGEAQALRDGWRDFSLALSEVINKRGQPYGVSLAEIAVIVGRSEIPPTPALAAERNHFAKSERKNDTNARNMALKRAERKGEGAGDGQK